MLLTSEPQNPALPTGRRSPGGRRMQASTRTGLIALLGTAALVLSGCGLGEDTSGEPEPASDYTVDAEASVAESPIWSAADEQSMLRIAVPFDHAGIGYLETNQSVPTGFAVEIGSLVAGRLGFAAHQITWVDAGDDPAAVLDGDEPAADLLIDTSDQPIPDIGPAAEPDSDDTDADEPQETPADLAGPYHLGGQALLSAASHSLDTVAELSDETVCAVPDSPGRTVLEEQSDAEVVERDALAECVTALAAGEVDAVIGADLDLHALAAQDQQALTVTADQFDPAGYWIRMREEDPALAEAIAGGIAAAAEDGEWDIAVESAFGREIELSPPPAD